MSTTRTRRKRARLFGRGRRVEHPQRSGPSWAKHVRRLTDAGLSDGDVAIIAALLGRGGLDAATVIGRGYGAATEAAREAVERAALAIHETAGYVGLVCGPRAAAVADMLAGVLAWAGLEREPDAVLNAMRAAAGDATSTPLTEPEAACFPDLSAISDLPGAVKRMIVLLGRLGRRPVFGAGEVFGALDLEAAGVKLRTLRHRLKRVRALKPEAWTPDVQGIGRTCGEWLRHAGEPLASAALGRLGELLGVRGAASANQSNGGPY